ncbi:WD repeat protein Lub1 [Entomophthora muscae]|uniref:WD repeat protein Lub1 n=1 Tax=Entomophthora muscae TaxID=34485 RepID=A0ACC2RFI3_9FUNG|nr:WD repeat protein Lub1 [Entomophthora muscae]
MKYELCKDFSGHSQDVKAVTSFDDRVVLSVSRDTTLRAWDLKSSSGEQQMGAETIFHWSSEICQLCQNLPSYS